ncbi:CbiX/SirB N-terminal domain-containing protein [Uliginosibacterium sp. H3]|uniref:CbiX/SirB N-terminal domain-containing protein n=1 Tax=Uliginosibacterium silvisoli TaxID=3114758 RepID=A0ABU6K667_9RHOO|nr:CbiX/SirB N-terminal domain-containing protein [Uliginosibacterium sp. H3]
MSRAIVLFAHGARDPEWARPMQRLAESVRAAEPGVPVFTAFLEFMTPDLPGAAEQAVQAGATELIVVPVFLAQGGHVRRDVPVMLARIRERHAGVRIELRDALGESQAVIDAMAKVVLGKA